MPFRVSLFSRLGKVQREVVLDLLREMVDVFNQSCTPITDGDDLPIFETTCSPFYKLLSFFEALICGPSGPTEKGNWRKLIDERLQKFRAAKIQPLFERAQLTRIIAPQDKQRIPDPASREQAAITFANLDNPGKAFRIVTATQPIALATTPVIRALQDLYPSECSYCPLERSSRNETSIGLGHSDPFITDQLFAADNIRDSLRRVKRGGASGGLSDSPDMFTALFLSQADPTSNDISDADINLFSTLLTQMLENKLSTEVSDFFTSSRLIAIHKDSEEHLKL